ncbi:hypothetical protein SAMN06273572_101128 [Monaibacterium marinum]|uniref:Uncharacterized protein n=1 Tax=Pontivivens marinum TaxID=1690039 RepID=A0A2C9CM47_9RHOB|nr:hypothetical protein SAMN06273572_101128 [Monaibacterium marinum]
MWRAQARIFMSLDIMNANSASFEEMLEQAADGLLDMRNS